jgi:undecaprenyl-diphosphatase
VGSEFVRRSGNYIFFWLGTTYSYPSSHAARAAFLAIALWVVLVGIGPLRDRRWLATTLCVTLALTLGFTRVYLGYHWFSDVLGGWALGIASAGATAWLVGRRRRTSAGVLIAPTQPVDDRPTGHG